MKLPIIKQLVDFAQRKDEDYLHETMEVLEDITDVASLKDKELDVIGELLSNIAGAIEVQEKIQSGQSQKQALNEFMQRVIGSIDN